MGFRLSCLSTYDSVSCPRHPKTICPLSPFLSVSCSRVGAQVTAPNSTTSLSLLFFLSSFELPDNFFELHFSPHPCARFLCFSLLYPHFLFSSYVSRRNNFGQTNIPLWDLFHLFQWNWSLWNLSPSNLSRSASLHQINPYHLSLLSLSCNLIHQIIFHFSANLCDTQLHLVRQGQRFLDFMLSLAFGFGPEAVLSGRSRTLWVSTPQLISTTLISTLLFLPFFLYQI